MAEVDLYGTPYVHDPTNPARAHRGANLCRRTLHAVRDAVADAYPLDPDDPVRDRALRRARAEAGGGGR